MGAGFVVSSGCTTAMPQPCKWPKTFEHHHLVLKHGCDAADIRAASRKLKALGSVLLLNALPGDVCSDVLSHMLKCEFAISQNAMNDRSEVGTGDRSSMVCDELWDSESLIGAMDLGCLHSLLRRYMRADCWRRYHIVKAGGDKVQPYTFNTQQTHSDGAGGLQLYSTPGPIFSLQGRCWSSALAFSFAVHGVSVDNAAIKISDWAAMESYVARNGMNPPAMEDENGVVERLPMPMGSILVRDVRVWHGGTQNERHNVRWLPGFVVASQYMMDCEYPYGYRPCRNLRNSRWSEVVQGHPGLKSHLDYVWRPY